MDGGIPGVFQKEKTVVQGKSQGDEGPSKNERKRESARKADGGRYKGQIKEEHREHIKQSSAARGKPFRYEGGL